MDRIPSYRRHAATNQAVVTIRTATGRKDVYLGVWNSPASKQEYARIIAELSANGGQSSATRPTSKLTVSELLLMFWQFAKGYYPSKSRHDGFQAALKPVLELYGNKPACDFGPLALKTVLNAYTQCDIVRKGANRRLSDVKHAFRWAASEELIPVTVYQSLCTVTGIRKGHVTMRESTPVPPVSEEVVTSTLPHMPKPVAAMVTIQQLTGMRPQEVCRLRPCEIEMTGDVWIFRPSEHKTAHHGKQRIICIGPRAQEVLRQYLPADPNELCFSPRKTMDVVIAAGSQNRQTPLYPSHLKNNKERRKGKVYSAGCYSVASYRQCIRRACLRANPTRYARRRVEAESVAT